MLVHKNRLVAPDDTFVPMFVHRIRSCVALLAGAGGARRRPGRDYLWSDCGF